MFFFLGLNEAWEKAYDFSVVSMPLISTGAIEEVPILLAKPQTYMNFSGESVCIVFLIIFIISYLIKILITYNRYCCRLKVGSLAAHYQVPLRHILLVNLLTIASLLSRTMFWIIAIFIEA